MKEEEEEEDERVPRPVLKREVVESREKGKKTRKRDGRERREKEETQNANEIILFSSRFLGVWCGRLDCSIE